MSIISAGMKFGLVTVTGAPESRSNGVYYECRCDCGATLTVSATRLRKKAETNGGCQQCAKGRTCKRCEGRMEDHDIIIYAKGYKAAGGNPDDIGLFIDGQALC